MRLLRLLPLAVLLLVPGWASGIGPRTGSLETNGVLKVGDRAPAWTVKDTSGKAVSLADFAGRPILLDFGSAFCKNCQNTAEWMVGVHREHGKKGLAVVMISVDGFGSRKAVAGALKGMGATYPVLFDEGFATAGRYGVSLIPNQFLIDRKGIVRSMHVGFEKDLFDARLLKRLLEEEGK